VRPFLFPAPIEATSVAFKPRARLLEEGEIRRAVTRIAHEILERNKGAADLVLVGIAARGDDLARRLAAEIQRIESVELPVGVLDITFYRDDIGLRTEAPEVHETRIPFDISGKTVVLVDDVRSSTSAGHMRSSWRCSWTAAIESCRSARITWARTFRPGRTT
jgi:pyrimidine operon attenuation protein/uracil phosphoribosyltransferase